MDKSKLEKQVEMGRLKEAVGEGRDLAYISEILDRTPGVVFTRIKQTYSGEENNEIIDRYQIQLEEWKREQKIKNCANYREANGINGYKSPRSRSTKL